MTPSFYQRLLRGQTELKVLLEGDVAAAQSDLRHLRLEQLLTIRVSTLDWATESHSHSAHTNFLMSLDMHLFERLAREFLRTIPDVKPATLHALGLRIALVAGAEEVISQGWGQQSVHGAGDALPALPQVWALALGPEWAPARVAFFHSRELWLQLCDGELRSVQDVVGGHKVAVTTDRSTGMGKDRFLHWEIAVLDPSFEDILDEIKQQDQAFAEQNWAWSSSRRRCPSSRLRSTRSCSKAELRNSLNFLQSCPRRPQLRSRQKDWRRLSLLRSSAHRSGPTEAQLIRQGRLTSTPPSPSQRQKCQRSPAGVPRRQDPAGSLCPKSQRSRTARLPSLGIHPNQSSRRRMVVSAHSCPVEGGDLARVRGRRGTRCWRDRCSAVASWLSHSFDCKSGYLQFSRSQNTLSPQTLRMRS